MRAGRLLERRAGFAPIRGRPIKCLHHGGAEDTEKTKNEFSLLFSPCPPRLRGESVLLWETTLAMTATQEKLEFRAELKQLLHLITHSLYSHREVFLRELISNASDAINKVRFDSLEHEDKLEGDKDWKIRIAPDKEKGTLTIADNGIGMSRDSIVENL